MPLIVAAYPTMLATLDIKKDGDRVDTMNVSTVEKMRVIAQVRAAIEICFAHWCDLPDFIFEEEFDRWIETIATIDDRREFSLATMRLWPFSETATRRSTTDGFGAQQVSRQASPPGR